MENCCRAPLWDQGFLSCCALVSVSHFSTPTWEKKEKDTSKTHVDNWKSQCPCYSCPEPGCSRQPQQPWAFVASGVPSPGCHVPGPVASQSLKAYQLHNRPSLQFGNDPRLPGSRHLALLVYCSCSSISCSWRWNWRGCLKQQYGQPGSPAVCDALLPLLGCAAQLESSGAFVTVLRVLTFKIEASSKALVEQLSIIWGWVGRHSLTSGDLARILLEGRPAPLRYLISLLLCTFKYQTMMGMPSRWAGLGHSFQTCRLNLFKRSHSVKHKGENVRIFI